MSDHPTPGQHEQADTHVHVVVYWLLGMIVVLILSLAFSAWYHKLMMRWVSHVDKSVQISPLADLKRTQLS